MKLEEYWQENKRFVWQVSGGVLVFLIGLGLISRSVGRDLTGARAERATQRSKLEKLRREGLSSEDLTQLETDQAELTAAFQTLAPRVHFELRPEYAADVADPSAGRYLSVVTRLRDRIFARASRANISIDPTFGLPEQSPTRPEEIERMLAGLDALERFLELCIDSGVARVDKLKVRLDPELFGRRGVGAIERTRIEARLRGENGAILSALAATQRGPLQALLIEKAELKSSRESAELAELNLTLVVARLAPTAVPPAAP